MNGSHDNLFAQGDAHTVQQHQLHHFNAEVNQIDSNRLLNTNLDALVDYFVEKYRVEVPELDEAGMQADQHEAQRDVSGDPNRMAFVLRRGPVYVTGTEVTVEIPFSGDASLFAVRPNTYSTSSPHGEVRGNLVVLRIRTEKLQPTEIRAQIDAWLAEVKRYLQWHRERMRNMKVNAYRQNRADPVATPTVPSSPCWTAASEEQIGR
jgi:hypothetical protein